MASTTYIQGDEGMMPQGFVRLTEAYRLLHRPEVRAIPPLAPDTAAVVEGETELTRSVALQGARAVVAAIFLESYAALSVYILWQIFRLFR
jgi:hypothetical protein